PERSFIHEEEGLTSYFPSDGFALAGQRVYLSWTFENLDPLDQPFIFVRFDKPLRETPIIAIVLGSIGGLVLGAFLTILFMRRREKKVVKEISTIYLSDTQKIILKLISENNGKMLQKELCAETGFTKSRISRNITPLVEQGLLQRDRWGRNYVIRLTDSGRKVIE
ncbi:MAG: winged helix DNA-binding protein, partial [Candidatus Heimdallarchaeota archaeon]|nr:winged helix DNA-binding protein [Candidatus Heimdallarchaeota archaeon]